MRARPGVGPVALLKDGGRCSILIAPRWRRAGDGQGHSLDSIISPMLLYLLVALGGVGVWLALPRRGLSPQPIGGLIAAVAGGLLLLALAVATRGHWPNFYFYIFTAIAMGGG